MPAHNFPTLRLLIALVEADAPCPVDIARAVWFASDGSVEGHFYVPTTHGTMRSHALHFSKEWPPDDRHSYTRGEDDVSRRRRQRRGVFETFTASSIVSSPVGGENNNNTDTSMLGRYDAVDIVAILILPASSDTTGSSGDRIEGATIDYLNAQRLQQYCDLPPSHSGGTQEALLLAFPSTFPMGARFTTMYLSCVLDAATGKARMVASEVQQSKHKLHDTNVDVLARTTLDDSQRSLHIPRGVRRRSEEILSILASAFPHSWWKASSATHDSSTRITPALQYLSLHLLVSHRGDDIKHIEKLSLLSVSKAPLPSVQTTSAVQSEHIVSNIRRSEDISWSYEDVTHNETTAGATTTRGEEKEKATQQQRISDPAASSRWRFVQDPPPPSGRGSSRLNDDPTSKQLGNGSSGSGGGGVHSSVLAHHHSKEAPLPNEHAAPGSFLLIDPPPPATGCSLGASCLVKKRRGNGTTYNSSRYLMDHQVVSDDKVQTLHHRHPQSSTTAAAREDDGGHAGGSQHRSRAIWQKYESVDVGVSFTKRSGQTNNKGQDYDSSLLRRLSESPVSQDMPQEVYMQRLTSGSLCGYLVEPLIPIGRDPNAALPRAATLGGLSHRHGMMVDNLEAVEDLDESWAAASTGGPANPKVTCSSSMALDRLKTVMAKEYHHPQQVTHLADPFVRVRHGLLVPPVSRSKNRKAEHEATVKSKQPNAQKHTIMSPELLNVMHPRSFMDRLLSMVSQQQNRVDTEGGRWSNAGEQINGDAFDGSIHETSPRSGSVTMLSSISSPGSPQRPLTTTATTTPPSLLLLGEGSAFSTNRSPPPAAPTKTVKPSAVVPTHREVLMKLAQIPDMHQWLDDVLYEVYSQHGGPSLRDHTGHQYRQQKAVVPHTTHYPTVSIAIGGGRVTAEAMFEFVFWAKHISELQSVRVTMTLSKKHTAVVVDDACSSMREEEEIRGESDATFTIVIDLLNFYAALSASSTCLQKQLHLVENFLLHTASETSIAQITNSHLGLLRSKQHAFVEELIKTSMRGGGGGGGDVTPSSVSVDVTNQVVSVADAMSLSGACTTLAAQKHHRNHQHHRPHHDEEAPESSRQRGRHDGHHHHHGDDGSKQHHAVSTEPSKQQRH